MMNEEIKAKEVRLVDKESARVVSRDEALRLADEQGLDLICISENGDIPVVKNHGLQ